MLQELLQRLYLCSVVVSFYGLKVEKCIYTYHVNLICSINWDKDKFSM